MERMYDGIVMALNEYCHGSGFDDTWDCTDKGTYIKACTSWHLMNDMGYYLGYYCFTVIIPKKHPGEYRIYGKSHSKRILDRYGVWEYIDETIYHALEDHGIIKR
jgi:hypothetical protein